MSSGRRLVDGLLSSGSRLSYVGLAAALTTLAFMVYLQGLARYGAQIGNPLARASAELEAGLDRSLVELRGWVAYQEPGAPAARAETWNRIDAALDQLKEAAAKARSREIQDRAEAIFGGLRDLRALQWAVEDVAGKPGNKRDFSFYSSRMEGLRIHILALSRGYLRSGARAGVSSGVDEKTMLLFQTLFLELDSAVQRLMGSGAKGDEAQLLEAVQRVDEMTMALTSDARAPARQSGALAEDRAEALKSLRDETQSYLRLVPELLARNKRPDLAQQIFEERIRPVLDEVVALTRALSQSQQDKRELALKTLLFWSFVVLFLALVLAAISGGSIYVQVRLQNRVSKAMARAQSLGQYALLERIGSGGMGVVYRAEHRLLQRPSALKLLKTRHESGRARFEDEVRLTSRLSHPNTIAIYDYGHTPDRQFYYVMELLDGVTLDLLVERTGPLPPSRAVHILEQVCASLGEAHDEGLLHRDIKSSNIMVARVGGVQDTVKVLDFGLVARTESIEDRGLLVGTPRYMAPEVIQAAASSPSSDIYAIGCVAYDLLTGGPVFEAQTVEAVLAAQVEALPERPSQRSGRDIPEELEAIVLGCLAKDPRDRPDSVRSLGAMLREVDVGRRWTAQDAEAWWAQHGDSLRTLARAREGAGSAVSRIEVIEVGSTGLGQA